MTHWKKAFKSDHLSASDVDKKDLCLTIKFVKYQECKTQSGKVYCNVAHFAESGHKPMILNVTNSKIVKKFSGNKTEVEEWLNIPVQIYVNNNVRFGNETVEGLRIRETQPTVAKKLTPLANDDIKKAIIFINGGKTIQDLKKYYSLTAEIEKELINQLNQQNEA